MLFHKKLAAAACALGVFFFLREPPPQQTQSATGIVITVSPQDSGTRNRIVESGAGTYIGDILSLPSRDSLLSRWPDRHGASLRVWIQRSRHAAFDTAFIPIVRSAFGEWERTGIPLTFMFVRDSSTADVHVTWINRFSKQISGKTTWAHDAAGWIVDADIIIALRRKNGKPLDPRAIRAISLHEVGHLIGLDHTRDTLSVMAPLVRVWNLSPADKATAQLLYTLPAGRVN